MTKLEHDDGTSVLHRVLKDHFPGALDRDLESVAYGFSRVGYTPDRLSKDLRGDLKGKDANELAVFILYQERKTAPSLGTETPGNPPVEYVPNSPKAGSKKTGRVQAPARSNLLTAGYSPGFRGGRAEYEDAARQDVHKVLQKTVGSVNNGLQEAVVRKVLDEGLSRRRLAKELKDHRVTTEAKLIRYVGYKPAPRPAEIMPARAFESLPHPQGQAQATHLTVNVTQQPTPEAPASPTEEPAPKPAEKKKERKPSAPAAGAKARTVKSKGYHIDGYNLTERKYESLIGKNSNIRYLDSAVKGNKENANENEREVAYLLGHFSDTYHLDRKDIASLAKRHELSKMGFGVTKAMEDRMTTYRPPRRSVARVASKRATRRSEHVEERGFWGSIGYKLKTVFGKAEVDTKATKAGLKAQKEAEAAQRKAEQAEKAYQAERLRMKMEENSLKAKIKAENMERKRKAKIENLERKRKATEEQWKADREELNRRLRQEPDRPHSITTFNYYMTRNAKWVLPAVALGGTFVGYLLHHPIDSLFGVHDTVYVPSDSTPTPTETISPSPTPTTNITPSPAPSLTDGTPDLDADGMDDDWERKYGLNPNANDANVDSDQDGYSNGQEYRNGTSPVDRNSPSKPPSSTNSGKESGGSGG